jgi:hypothetical protein
MSLSTFLPGIAIEAPKPAVSVRNALRVIFHMEVVPVGLFQTAARSRLKNIRPQDAKSTSAFMILNNASSRIL